MHISYYYPNGTVCRPRCDSVEISSCYAYPVLVFKILQNHKQVDVAVTSRFTAGNRSENADLDDSRHIGRHRPSGNSSVFKSRRAGKPLFDNSHSTQSTLPVWVGTRAGRPGRGSGHFSQFSSQVFHLVAEAGGVFEAQLCCRVSHLLL